MRLETIEHDRVSLPLAYPFRTAYSDETAWVNIKLGRVGGLTNAPAIHDLCQTAAIPCWVGGMLESAEDLCEPGLELSGPSEMTAPPGPGIGCAPQAGRLARFQVEQAVVR